MVGRKVRIASTSLAGCFGCHMSMLDIDERLLGLVERVDIDRSPLTDVKTCSPGVDVGFIEGGVCNAENVHTLREFRHNCRILVAVGACALTGGVPAMRNGLPLRACLEESYVSGIGVDHPMIPNDPELPLLLNKVHPVHEIVPVDIFLPGCPPPADAIWELFDALLAGREPTLTPAMHHFD